MRIFYKNKVRRSVLKQNTAGFTLLEVLIASAILGIGLMAFGSAESLSVVNSRRGQTDAWATAASDEIIERMRKNRTDILNYNGFDTANAATRPTTAGKLQDDYDQWKANVEMESLSCGTVAVAANTPVSPVNTVTVTVRQPPCTAGSRQVTVQTFLEIF
ncbi:MAG: prepilin-type N-terminal cleavage/methylation domain-containing protein [Nitrospiria bacterium]